VSDPDRPRPSARRHGPAATTPADGDADVAGARSTAVAEHDEEPATDAGTVTGTGTGAGSHVATETDAPTDSPAQDRTDDEPDEADAPARRRRRISVPLAPALGVLLLLLLALNAYLLAPRLFGEESSVRTGTYVDVLQAARSNVVDLTSFDYLTIDDDIEQARRVTTGDLTDESVSGLEEARQQIVDAQAVTSSEVVGAGVTRATEDEGTVVMVIATTRQAAGVPAQVRRDRIEVDLQREGDRWLLSAIRGTGSDD
jgi:Mce-associated membrane protein